MAVQLEVWNNALRHVGETRLATVTDTVEARYVLDGIYTKAINYCLRQGMWNFAMRFAEIAKDATAPSFGYSNRFAKPVDWVRTAALSASPMLQPPLEDYEDETSWWRANVDPIFVKYVSNHATLGGLLLTAWPETFTNYVEFELAWRMGKRVNQSETDRETLKRDRREAKLDALSKDAMDEAAPRYPQPGRFVRSRMGASSSARDFWRW